MNADNITLCNWGECCAVRPDPNGGVWLSSTRRPGVEVLLDGDEWASFLAAVKAGEHDTDPQVNALPAAVTVDRDELDVWMRDRDLMLISNRHFADLTRELAAARLSTTRVHSARLAVLAYLDECDNGMGTANPELIRAQLEEWDVSAGQE